MPESEIIFTKEKGIATVIFNRTEVHNALNNAMVKELAKALDEI